MHRVLTASLSAALLSACASLGALGGLVQPPQFERDRDRPAEIRVLAPSVARPAGGAGVRLFARVRNPNAFGLRLTDVTGELFLEGARAANVDLPLGLPLRAYEDAVIPIDLSVDFHDVPGLLGVGTRVLARQEVEYRLDGTVSVDAGRLGQPRFGPSTLLQGDLQPRR